MKEIKIDPDRIEGKIEDIIKYYCGIWIKYGNVTIEDVGIDETVYIFCIN